MSFDKKTKIFIAGHKGMVGSSILRVLKDKGFKNILTIDKKKVNLLDNKKILKYFKLNKPDIIFLAAARVGGIKANNAYPYNFMYENLSIQNNIINSARINKIKRLIFLGSSCIYPKFSKQPMKEQYLLDSKLEPTNEAYALAKICGIKLCGYINRQFKSENFDFRSIIPPNLYGPNDNYNLENSHVIPALIKKIYLAKYEKKNFVEIWGTGKPKREFMHVDDLAEIALKIAALNYKQIRSKLRMNNEITINVGTGEEISIKELAKLIKKIIKFNGKLKFNNNLDGTPRKIMCLQNMRLLNIKSKIYLKSGIKKLINNLNIRDLTD